AGTIALTKVGSGTFTLIGSNTFTGGTTINAGKLLLNTSLTTSSSVQASGGTMELAAGGTKIVRTNSVSASNSGRIDLQDNKLVGTAVGGNGAANLTAVTSLIAIGRNGGTWDGVNGIMTSQLLADTGLTALGVAPATSGRIFGGQTLNAGDVM